MVYKKFHNTQDVSLKLILLPILFYSFVAGHINSIFFSLYSVPLSHMTGNITQLGNVVSYSNLSVLFVLFVVLTSFLGGSIFSGFILEGATFEPGERYGILTIFEGILIFLVALLGSEYFWLALVLCSFSMGLQNAFISSYKGIIIRTTHMTGIVTDLGFLIGSSIKSKRIDKNKIVFFMLILFSFVGGAMSGYSCALFFQFHSLFIIALFLMVGGTFYLIKRIKKSMK